MHSSEARTITRTLSEARFRGSNLEDVWSPKLESPLFRSTEVYHTCPSALDGIAFVLDCMYSTPPVFQCFTPEVPEVPDTTGMQGVVNDSRCAHLYITYYLDVLLLKSKVPDAVSNLNG